MTAAREFASGWLLAALRRAVGRRGRLVVPRAGPARSAAAVSLTFSEEIANSQVAVIAKLVASAPAPKADAAAANSLEVAKAKFEIIKVLKGEDALGTNRTIETVYFGDSPAGRQVPDHGHRPADDQLEHADRDQRARRASTSPRPSSCPRKAPTGWPSFQDYLEDNDEMLARDAYDEFAKTPYSGVLRAQGPHEARQAGRVDQEPADSGEPPAAVPDDAGRLRHARTTCRCWKR